ncbi:hypothetical protein L211DRAFT_852252 [Terfezia boudieri ATCC MYA-4762]|uniref:Uncharacterized protein n=1 Tax=Terfezia boudieri ATCC MYA-4762 TaxID=1051890 RepID=A0A3N4LCW0_9PEZI|nr:hypothetical protein L211DRAFT_852252 [Terfezia boudieri ATCC MYA-4762]
MARGWFPSLGVRGLSNFKLSWMRLDRVCDTLLCEIYDMKQKNTVETRGQENSYFQISWDVLLLLNAECCLQNAAYRLLLTQWFAEAWEGVYKDHKDLIIRSFQKCGNTVALDGSEDQSINIHGMDGYTVGAIELEEESECSESDSSESELMVQGSHLIFT